MSGFGTVAGTDIRGNTITKPMSTQVGGYTANFDITVSASSTGSVGFTSTSFGSGIWSRAVMGNTINGTPYYTGVVGQPALYELSDPTSPYALPGQRETVTLNNLVVTNSSGQQISNYSLVMTDAESTNANEGFVWSSDVPLNNLQEVIPPDGNTVTGNTNAPYGTPCDSTLTGFGTTTVTCMSSLLPGETSASARGIVMVQADSATTISTQITGRGGSGRQGIAFAIALPPIAYDASTTINPNQTATLNPVTHPGTKPITAVAFDNGLPTKTVPSEGTWSISLANGQPVATFTPLPNYSGPVTTQPYTITDSAGNIATANLAVTINTPPTTGDKSVTIAPNQTATLNPTTAPGTGTITGATFDNGQTTKTVTGEGTWSISLTNGQPVATFTPNSNYTGPVTTQAYTVTDSNGLTATGNLSVTINTPPATGDKSVTINPNQTATLNPTTTPGTGTITGATFDNGQTSKTVPGEGTWSITVTNGQPVATFTPDTNYTGPVTQQAYTVTDSNGLTASGNLTVSINTPPATGNAQVTINPNQTATLNPTTTPGTGTVTGATFDNGQTTKTVTGEGTWSITVTNGQPVATFTPDSNYSGTVTPQSYTVTDSNGLTATGNLTVSINTPPATGDKSVTINPNQTATLNPTTTPGTGTITGAAFDNGQTSKAVTGEGSWSITVTNGQPVATFTPDSNYTGPVTTQAYTVTDSTGLTASGNLSVAINTPPATGDKSVTINPNQTATLNPTTTPGTGTVTGAAFDNGQASKTVPGEGTWSISLTNGQPVATFTPDSNYTGPVTTQVYTVSDSNGLTASGNLSVSINTPPATGDASVSINPNETATLFPVTTPGTGSITAAVFDNGQTSKRVPGEGTWSISLTNGQPVATFTPDTNYAGPVTAQAYTVTDSNGLSATGTLSVTILTPTVVTTPTGPVAATPTPAPIAPSPTAAATTAGSSSVMVNTGGVIAPAANVFGWAATALAGVLLLAAAGFLGWRRRNTRQQ